MPFGTGADRIRRRCVQSSQQGGDAHEEPQSFGGDALQATTEYVLIALSIALVVSLARSDRAARRG